MVNDNDADSTQIPVATSAENQTSPQTLVDVDEFGDPMIKGPYVGQDQPNMDALFPGRHTQEEDASSESDESVQILPSMEQSQRQTVQIRIVFLVFCCVWLFVGWKQFLGSTKARVKTPTTSSAAVVRRDTVEGYSIDKLLSSGTNEYFNGDDANAQLVYQQTLSRASSREDAMKLIVYGDRLIAYGKPKLAEPFYRRAMSVLGLTAGPTSWEYLQALTKLSNFCHSMKRFQEEEELNAFIKRLSAVAASARS